MNEMKKLSDQEISAFIRKMNEALLPMFNRCIVPIFGQQNGAVIQCGTGTLFRVADVSFLVTASHVIDITSKNNLQLYISDNVSGAEGIPLAGQVHNEPNFDVAVWELTPKIVQKLPNRDFLTVHQADKARKRITPGWYYIYGYPNCWSQTIQHEQKTVVKSFSYGTVLYHGDTDILGGYDPDIHVLLSVEGRNVDSNGLTADLPEKLSGISGCSLWQAYYEGLSIRDWSPDDARVVAVQTGVYQRGKIIKGTCWFLVLEIIRRCYPELETPLSIVTPYKRGATK